MLAHAVAFGAVWGTIGLQSPAKPLQPAQDVWVGTTVSVLEDSKRASLLSRSESTQVIEQAQAAINIRSPINPKVVVSRTPASISGVVGDSRTAQRLVPSGAPRTLAEPASNPMPAVSATNASQSDAVDLKQAMLDAANQKVSGTGSFGAVGVDLRERRLPAAFTRALPVAIGAEVGWWRHQQGTQGKIRFEVALDESGKIQAVTVEDGAKLAFLARIVQRVGRLLAVGRYSLPEAATPNARQRFELRLDLEQGTPSSNETAEHGDAVDMGWEAPSASGPGKAHIQEARGRTMRAVLKVLPQTRDITVVDSETAPIVQ